MNTALVTALGALLVAVVSGLVTWIVARVNVRPADKTADASFQQAMNEGFATITARYEAMNAELMERVDQLSGEVRDLTQHIESLERILRDEGLPVPERRRPHRLARPPLAGL